MPVYEDYKEAIERYQLMMGAERGRLAMSLDLLTDALVLVGQHGVYCRSARQPGRPAMDVQLILKGIEDAKVLIGDAMAGLKGGGAS
jgi:hypothetical protein